MAGFLPARPCCQLSELLGIYFGSRARLIRNQGDKAAYFSLLRNAIARKVVRLGRSVDHMDAKYQALKTKKRMAFFIELALPRGITPAFTQAAANVVPDATCDRKAMLRGLFLGCGSVNAPSARYHLEFVAPSAAWATAIGGMAESAGAKVGVMERGGQHRQDRRFRASPGGCDRAARNDRKARRAAAGPARDGPLAQRQP